LISRDSKSLQDREGDLQKKIVGFFEELGINKPF
jgi:hypothetical protein